MIDYLLGEGEYERPKNRREKRWQMVTPPPHEVVRTHLHERFLHEIPSYKTNKVHKVGEDLQLLMNIQVRTNDGTRKSVSVLVDTGAEANLVRGGLFNDSLMRNAREALSFFYSERTTFGRGQANFGTHLVF